MSRVVLVELFVQESETLGFIVRADWESPRLERLAVGRAGLLDWTKGFLRTIVSGDTASRVEQAPLQPLLDAVEQDTDEEDVIYFVPHGALHLVPLHALEMSGAPLIRRNPVVYAPSASVLASIARRDDRTEQGGAMVVGDTRGDLPYASEEADLVADILAVEAMPGREATRRRLIEAIRTAGTLRILHLACHGTFSEENGFDSGILTALGDDGDEAAAVLTAQDLLDMHVRADLVALSACDSGISERRPGDELVGLTRALLVAGARTVLASLWKVNDLSTSIVMRAFYEGWVRDGLSKAEALRRAQCHAMDLTAADLLATDIPRLALAAERDFGGAVPENVATEPPDPSVRVFAAPRHWAAFTLVGDWR